MLQVGCTVPAAYCPADARYFRSNTAGALVGGDADVYCAKTSPAVCPTNGATSTASIAVRASNVAGDSAATILGCINAATGNGDLGSNCPTDVPIAGDYTFFVAASTTVAGPPAVTAGNVVECRVRDATRSCGSLTSVRTYSATAPAGCIALAANNPCPATGYTGSAAPGLAATFGLYGPLAASDATARLEACITNPETAAGSASRDCSLVAPSNTYTVPINTDNLAITPASGSTLVGCARTNTACPAPAAPATTYYPIIGSDLKITACRAQAAAAITLCPAGYVQLCDATAGGSIDASGICTAGNTKGCLAQLGVVATDCNKLTSSSNYPTALAYKFVATLQNAATSVLTSCAWTNTRTDCPAAANTYDVEAWPTGKHLVIMPCSSCFCLKAYLTCGKTPDSGLYLTVDCILYCILRKLPVGQHCYFRTAPVHIIQLTRDVSCSAVQPPLEELTSGAASTTSASARRGGHKLWVSQLERARKWAVAAAVEEAGPACSHVLLPCV
jgi:hypothetical protein